MSRSDRINAQVGVLFIEGFCLNPRLNGGDSLFLSIAEVEINLLQAVGDCEFLGNVVKLDIGCPLGKRRNSRSLFFRQNIDFRRT